MIDKIINLLEQSELEIHDITDCYSDNLNVLEAFYITDFMEEFEANIIIHKNNTITFENEIFTVDDFLEMDILNLFLKLSQKIEE